MLKGDAFLLRDGIDLGNFNIINYNWLGKEMLKLKNLGTDEIFEFECYFKVTSISDVPISKTFEIVIEDFKLVFSGKDIQVLSFSGEFQLRYNNLFFVFDKATEDLIFIYKSGCANIHTVLMDRVVYINSSYNLKAFMEYKCRYGHNKSRKYTVNLSKLRRK